jgi:hypothetical protein
MVVLATLGCWGPVGVRAAAAAEAEDAATAEDAAGHPLQPIHCRCVWITDPRDSATLSWSTRAVGGEHRLAYRKLGDDAWQWQVAQHNGAFSSQAMRLFYHHAKIRRLTPGTTYEVVMHSGDHASGVYHFNTAPAEDVPVSLLFGADSRSGRNERQQVNRMLANMLAESYRSGRTPILALAHGGDFIANGDQLEQWDEWLSDHQLTTTDGRLLPIIPTRGNHDVGILFNEVFAQPAHSRNYYAINVGPQLRWITLNTETSVAGAQTQWLEAELDSSRPVYRWVVAQYHRPALAAVKIPFRAMAFWVPLFERFNVDLVCEGDGHCIKRTAPVRNNQIDATGVVYIGEGGLGVGQRSPKADRWYLREPHAKVGQGHHVQLLTFDQQRIHYRVVLLGGEIFDETSLAVRSPQQRQPPFAASAAN